MTHTPKKRFGQNFLTDTVVLNDIIRAIRPQQNDAMVEIGPGLGAMTQYLLQHVDHVHAVELDRDLVAHLKKKFDPAKLTIHAADALQFDFRQLVSSQEKKLRIVGNLPYNISTPLLFHLADIAQSVEDQHFMLQKEVVERMVALPGTKAFGRLSVMLQWRYDMAMLMTVSPKAFHPAPKVDSAIVRMIPKAHPLSCDPNRLQSVVTKAFSQRRKVIKNCMAGMFSEAQLVDAGIDPTLRPEAIAMEQYLTLANMPY